MKGFYMRLFLNFGCIFFLPDNRIPCLGSYSERITPNHEYMTTWCAQRILELHNSFTVHTCRESITDCELVLEYTIAPTYPIAYFCRELPLSKCQCRTRDRLAIMAHTLPCPILECCSWTHLRMYYCCPIDTLLAE